jgi:hypothetical protein
LRSVRPIRLWKSSRPSSKASELRSRIGGETVPLCQRQKFSALMQNAAYTARSSLLTNQSGLSVCTFGLSSVTISRVLNLCYKVPARLHQLSKRKMYTPRSASGSRKLSRQKLQRRQGSSMVDPSMPKTARSLVGYVHQRQRDNRAENCSHQAMNLILMVSLLAALLSSLR